MTVNELHARFPYMFTGPHLGRTHFRGWFPIFAQLCIAIDVLLGADKRGFRWVQVKQKYGTARFYFETTAPSNAPWFQAPEEPDFVEHFLTALVDQAEKLTESACIRCGAPAEVMHLDSYVWTLCPAHRPPIGAQRPQLLNFLHRMRRDLYAE